MKKRMIALSLLIFALAQIKSQTMLRSDIDEVKVYRQKAIIYRTASIDLANDTKQLIISNIESSIDPKSLQVKLTGPATLLSSSYQVNYLAPSELPEVKRLKDSLDLISKQIEEQKMEKDVLSKEESIIYQNSLPGKQDFTPNASNTQAIARFFSQRVMQIREQMLSIQQKTDQLNKRKEQINNQLNKLHNRGKEASGELHLGIQPAGKGTASIRFSYIVHQAGWRPVYDVRCEGSGEPVNFLYKAQIRQNTGHNWDQVRLIVSTGTPAENQTRPVLHPIHADFKKQVRIQNDVVRGVSMSSKAQKKQSFQELSVRSAGRQRPTDIVTAKANELMVNYEIDASQQIPSDNQNHLVQLQSFNIPAQYTFYTAPRARNEAFLIGKISDYGKYNLLPATANIFYEGSYTGKTHINPDQAKDTLMLSFGKDPAINIQRKTIKDLTKNQFIGKKQIENKGYEIIIRNNKDHAIQLEVHDQIPVSKHQDIKIELLEKNGANYNKTYGLLKWNLEIAPDKSKSVRFSYSVEYPKEEEVVVR